MTPICDHCGAPIASPKQNERYKWRHIRTPLGDAPTLLGVLRSLVLITVILVLLLFLGELIFSPNKQNAVTMFTSSGILPWAFGLLGGCIAVACLDLGLQGSEEMHFVVDARGAHLQVWIAPTRLRCLARFIRYDPLSIAVDPEGNPRMLVSETHLVWADVARCEVRRHACRIDLYRPSGFRFLSLYIPPQEMEAVESYIMPKMKQLGRR